MDMFFNRGDPLVNEPTSSDKKQQEHDAHGEFEVNVLENTYDATQSFNDNQLRSFDNQEGSALDNED